MKAPARFLQGAPILAALIAAGSLQAKSFTIDGDPSDWTGTAPAQVHDILISQEEWIYKGEAGDLRNDPPNPAVRPNYDLTEVRVSQDATYLYLLVRMADISTTDEVSVCIGIDSDQSAGDSNGLNFLGDDSGVGLASGAAQHPEYLIQFHNAQAGITWGEYFHDAGGGTWFSNPGDTNSFISAANDVLEARILLASVGLTPTSTFKLSLVTFDNGSTADPSVVGFCNDTDTTVDYPGNDALDGMGGTVGVSQNAFDRLFPPVPPSTEPGPYTGTGVTAITLPVESRIDEWFIIGPD